MCNKTILTILFSLIGLSILFFATGENKLYSIIFFLFAMSSLGPSEYHKPL